MKLIFKIILTIYIFVHLSGCDFIGNFERGNGNVILENRKVNSFNTLRIGGNFEVLLEKGDKSNVKVITDENLHKYISIESSGDELIITQEKKLISVSKIELIITYEALSRIRVIGAAKVMCEETMNAGELEVKLDGAGVVDLILKTNKVEVELNGAGIVKLAGETYSQKLRLNGAGSLNAFDFNSKECDVVVSGLGTAKVFVTEKLNAKIEGVGTIEYAGNPEERVTEMSGLGKIMETTDF